MRQSLSSSGLCRRQGLGALAPALPHLPAGREVCSARRFTVARVVSRSPAEESVATVSSVAASLTSYSSQDLEKLMSPTPSCELGGVAEAMRTAARGIITAFPNETLESCISRLSKVTGMPVLSESGHVVGVISRKDIIRVRRAKGSLQDSVAQHMTSPAITISETASVQEAADVMLKNKIRRLPVVDEFGLPVGILSKSDIFKPLFLDQYTQYLDKEVAALQGVSKKPKKKAKKITWAIKYLYDGDCAMCQSLKKVLERQDNGRGKIKFVDIASEDFNPSKNMGIAYEEAMETIHAIRPDGEVLYGTDALRAMFDEVGLGWATKLSELPLLAAVVDLLYNFLSANRISLGGAMDAIIAAKRVEMSKQGVESCGDVDEECKVEW